MSVFGCVWVYECMSVCVCEVMCPSSLSSAKLQIIFHKRATKYRLILRKMTYKDKGSYEFPRPCIICYTKAGKSTLVNRSHPFIFGSCPPLFHSFAPFFSCCNTLSNTLQRTATHCNALQHTATHCNTLQLSATHCNTLQQVDTRGIGIRRRHAVRCCNKIK